jgi:hypothetical protein
MSLQIDFNDPDAWDDNELVDSWNQAFAEFQKFHSIHVSGKTLAETLTKEEIADLEKRGISLKRQPANGEVHSLQDDDVEDLQEPEEELMEEEYVELDAEVNGQDHNRSGANGDDFAFQTSEIPPQAQIPPLLLNSVPDESLKNLMMSWYWAGYYTGFHQGKNARPGAT